MIISQLPETEHQEARVVAQGAVVADLWRMAEQGILRLQLLYKDTKVVTEPQQVVLQGQVVVEQVVLGAVYLVLQPEQVVWVQALPSLELWLPTQAVVAVGQIRDLVVQEV